ncbi:MAG: ABC transporter permease [Desulfobacterales bacterium]
MGTILKILAIGIKEMKVIWKDKEGLALLFLMPAFFILVMSFALQGVFESGSKNQPLQILLINHDRGEVSEKIIEELSQHEGITLHSRHQRQNLNIEQSEALLRQKEYIFLLIFANNFSERIVHPSEAENPSPTVIFVFDPTLNRQLLAPVEGAIRSVVEHHASMVRIHHLLARELGPWEALMENGQGGSFGDSANPADRVFEEMKAGGRRNSGVVFQTRMPSGMKRVERPSATEQNVPAYTIFGVFFIALTLASSIYREKTDGTFQRLLAAPLSKGALLLGKLLPYHLVNLVQIALMFSIGAVFFHLNLGNLPALFFVSLSLSITANGLGLLVAAFSRTEAQINGFSVLLAITLSALGGMMVPSFVMPDVLETISLLTPHAWALKAYHDCIIRGMGIREVLPEIGILIMFGSVFFGIALWRFRFR